jgi:cobalt-zinc-cadmium efflux system protein
VSRRRTVPSDCTHVRPAQAIGCVGGHGHPHAHDGQGHGHAHDQAHAHDHDHAHGGLGHAHAHGASTRALRIALVLTATLLVVEVVGGWLANSLALLADAGHMLTDAGALALSLFVAWFSRQPSAPEKTYGYLRAEILAALVNGATLLGVSGVIIWEAVARLRTPEPVASGLMLGVATAGLVVNVISAWVLHGGAQHSLNHRGAYLHVVGDLLASVGTVTAALVVRYTGWLTIDPLASVVTTLVVVRSAWRLVREAVDVLLEAAPRHISLDAVRAGLRNVPGVDSVHDLHVWSVASGLVAMSAHAVVPDLARHDGALREMDAAMRALGIHHVTLQLERSAIDPCTPRPLTAGSADAAHGRVAAA